MGCDFQIIAGITVFRVWKWRRAGNRQWIIVNFQLLMRWWRETAVIIPIPKTLQFICIRFVGGRLGFVLDWALASGVWLRQETSYSSKGFANKYDLPNWTNIP